METDTILNETTVKLRKADSTARRRKTSFPITWSILALPLVLFFTIPILAIFLKTPLIRKLKAIYRNRYNPYNHNQQIKKGTMKIFRLWKNL